MNERSHILVLSFTDMKNDPREYRQIQALRHEYKVTAFGTGDPEIEGVDFFPVTIHPSRNWFERIYRAGTLLWGNFLPYLQGRNRPPEQLSAGMRFDAVVANDLDALPLGFALANGAPVIFDAHEYYPGQSTDSFFWRLFFQRPTYALCRKLLPLCAGMMTVSPGLAEKYQREFGVVPELVYNMPAYHELLPVPTSPNRIRMIHHGIAAPGRKLENMIETLQLLDDRFTLDFMLVADTKGYLQRLKEKGAGMPRLRFVDPVPMTEIVQTIAQYDMGIFLLEPNTFNHRHFMPNKLFEFIQARLAVAVTPLPDMGAFVHENAVGVVSDDYTPQALAAKLNALATEDIDRFKANADKAARLCNAEKNIPLIKGLVEKVLAIEHT